MMTTGIANTPRPPYYAVIFTSVRTTTDKGYADMAAKMLALAVEQPGYLGVETAHEELGLTVSYWSTLESIKQWKNHAEHRFAQQLGRTVWYASFKVRISKVEQDYGSHG